MLDRFRDLIVLAAVPDAGQTGLIDAPPDRLDLMSRQAERFGLAEPHPRRRDHEQRPGPDARRDVAAAAARADVRAGPAAGREHVTRRPFWRGWNGWNGWNTVVAWPARRSMSRRSRNHRPGRAVPPRRRRARPAGPARARLPRRMRFPPPGPRSRPTESRGTGTPARPRPAGDDAVRGSPPSAAPEAGPAAEAAPAPEAAAQPPPGPAGSPPRREPK